MAMTIEPCPFCGSKGAALGGMFPWVQCDQCEATGPQRDTDDEAIAAWNRANITQPAQAVDVADVRTLLECLEDEHGGDHFEAECPRCRAFERITRALGTAQEEWWVTVDPVAMFGCDDACQVKLHCGPQHFPVGDAHETRADGEWYAAQLRIALRIPVPPTDGEG